ncbi:CRE-SRA-12 protein [Caenorhabditis remanei]|uniref:CRE-SRA-12 protein n=1 Tax=Caenorhabditis remanei TaxID=31234 RepID=E3M449_CAERE|nr:CRE-SRA-12 protein [Caenorhabditis remanei]
MLCASEIQVEIYTSPVQLIYACFQTILFLATIIGSLLAIIELSKKTTIPDSTRVLLVGSLFFANAHELAYFSSPVSSSVFQFNSFIYFQLKVFQMSLFHSNSSCYPLASTLECIPTTTVLSMGISGNMLIQSALSVDRFVREFINEITLMRALPGFALLFIVLIPSFLSYSWIRSDIVLDDYQMFCSQWSAKISTRANLFLELCSYLTVAHIIINLLIILRNQSVEGKCRFDVQQRYLTSETLKTTQTICYLSIAQFLAMFLYSGGVLLMRKNQKNIPPIVYTNVIVWVYAPPYACVSLAPLILYSLWNLKKQRQIRIQSITVQKETQDDHMRKLQISWG